MDTQQPLAQALQRAIGGPIAELRPLQASGFCATWSAESAHGALFVKVRPVAEADVLATEADGLVAIAATGSVRVPAVHACAADAGSGIALLALEQLALHPPDTGYGARFGAVLGALHRAGPWPGYGWRRDNWIGATPQANRANGDWLTFYATQRLAPMRDRLAPHDAALADAVGAVIAALPRYFEDGHVPRPSLIHGDLWSGNWGMLADGTPAIYDPAVSCSDAEAELAMMELFGRAPAGFFESYRAAAGLHPGYPRRRPLYQLYHLLNHAVLFGGGYLQQALATARSLLRQR